LKAIDSLAPVSSMYLWKTVFFPTDVPFVEAQTQSVSLYLEQDKMQSTSFIQLLKKKAKP